MKHRTIILLVIAVAVGAVVLIACYAAVYAFVSWLITAE